MVYGKIRVAGEGNGSVADRPGHDMGSFIQPEAIEGFCRE